MLLVESNPAPVEAPIIYWFWSAANNVEINVVSPKTVVYLKTGIPVSAKIPSSLKTPSLYR